MRSRLGRLALVGLLVGLLLSAGLLVSDRIGGFFEPPSLRTRVEAVSFEPPAGWLVASGGELAIREAFTSAGLADPNEALDLLNVNERTQALALLVEDGEAAQALRADLLPAEGQGDPVGIREAALISIETLDPATVERFERGDGELPYAGYRAGEGRERRSVLFISFVPGIVRITILAPDAVADLLIASLAYDPPAVLEESPSAPAP